jgi:flavodoxin
MKKCLIIYYSYHHGNTKKVAEAMAEASGAELCTVEEAGAKNLDGYEIIGLGAGIDRGKHYAPLFDAAEKLNLKGRNVFVFSTSGVGNKNYNTPLIRELESAGATVAGSFTCRGYDTQVFRLVGGIAKGHPDTGEIEAAKAFAKSMVSE